MPSFATWVITVLFICHNGNAFFDKCFQNPFLGRHKYRFLIEPSSTSALVQRYNHIGKSFLSATNADDGNSDWRENPQRLPSIPIIGPIPSASPLTIGAEFLLDPPTPLQWKALQESVTVHRNKQTAVAQNSLLAEGEDGIQTFATIDAAPIVAFIDDVTGLSMVYPSHDQKGKGGRYATIAAVVGIKVKKQRERNYENDDFMDFYNNVRDSNTISPLDSTVRLLGVGRACLHRFFYRTPNDVDETDDAYEEDEYYESDDDEYYENDDYSGYEDNTPIIMADFQIVLDDSSFNAEASIDDVGQRGIRSPRSSPVHTLNYLYGIAQKVYRAHDRRRRLVLGIKAGISRLELNARKRNEALFDDIADYDGFGLLFSSRQGGWSNATGDNLMDDELLSILPTDNASLNEQDTFEHIKELLSLDNYGLAYYGSFSRISDLARVLSKTLEPYYSTNFMSREENEWEVASFVAFRCLEGYIDSSQVAWSLKCTSSIDRLRAALVLMMEHEDKLHCVAHFISNRLRTCGEECSDLW